MKKYETSISTYIKGRIDSWAVANILEEELASFLGDKDRFISNGIIRESDYRFNGSEEIREATPDEIELYNAFLLLANYFKKLK